MLFSFCGGLTVSSLESILKTFWEIEEVPSDKSEPLEDSLVFQETCHRLPGGRFCISVLLKACSPAFFGSLEIAHQKL